MWAGADVPPPMPCRGGPVSEANTWTVISLGDKRQYAGNTGYDDDLRIVYRYDSSVANSKNVAAGDLLLVRDRKRLLGFGSVQKIVNEEGTKERRRCPVCDTTALKKRKDNKAPWRCGNKHEFATPKIQKEPVKLYAAFFGDTFTDPPGEVPASLLRKAAYKQNDQLSIERTNISTLAGLLAKTSPKAMQMIERALQAQVLGPAEGDEEADTSAFEPNVHDRRDAINRSIKVRRGQQKFRRALLKKFGGRCAITNCSITAILEAAHIWPYRGDADHHLSNGLLLRADLHTLFDLNLVAVEPETLTIAVHSSLAMSEYGYLNGKELRKTGGLSKPLLAERWAVFQMKT